MNLTTPNERKESLITIADTKAHVRESLSSVAALTKTLVTLRGKSRVAPARLIQPRVP